jgi:hypothetical protein
MGLFTVLNDTINAKSSSGSASPPTSCGTIPTILQLYTDTPIQLETTSVLTGYSSLTYQAIQIGDEVDEELNSKNRHETPDLGVWNCRADTNLVDALLATVATSIRVFCFTVDLAQPHLVERNMTRLQHALVRHLIEHPPTTEATPRQTATTSLYQLQMVDFGRANEDSQNPSADSSKERNVNESFKDVTTTLMICAKLPLVQPGEEEDYKLKQAQALVIYHLRKFAAALNCTLCFVHPTKTSKDSPDNVETSTAAAKDASANATTLSSMQPTVDYHTVSEWWRALALDEKIWEATSSSQSAPSISKSLSLSSSKDQGEEPGAEEETTTTTQVEEEAATPETVEVATPLYGPGKHQEDLLETVVLRSATYPGHWDASKDSLWIALPAPKEEQPTEAPKLTGDRGWLSQLRESIASAQDLQPAIASPEKQPEDDKKKDGKDAEVSDFFASLLKKP